MLNTYLPLVLAGLALYILVAVWRACAGKWKDWGPRRRKYTRAVFIACAVMLAFYLAATVGDATVNRGAALLCIALGLVAPQAFRHWHVGKTARQKQDDDEGQLQVASLALAGVAVPEDAERGHILLAGSSPARDVVLAQLMSQVRRRGDTLVVFDGDGRLAASHFDPSCDFIFNPFDARCVSWSPLTELGELEPELLAEELVAAAGLPDAHAQECAAFLAVTISDLRARGQLTMRELLVAIGQAPREELQERIGDPRLTALLADEQAFGVLRRRTQAVVSGYEMVPTGGDPFSIRQMLQAEHSGVLFITTGSDATHAMRNVSRFLCDTAFGCVLSMDSSLSRRCWFVVPEPGALTGSASLRLWMARSKAAGASLVLGMRDTAQMLARFGEDANSVMQACAVRVVFTCRDQLTGQVLEALLAPGPTCKVRMTAQGLAELGPMQVVVQVGAGQTTQVRSVSGH